MSEQRMETTAQLIHDQSHRMGTAQVCQKCRDLGERIDRVYRNAPVTRSPSKPVRPSITGMSRSGG